MALSAEYKIELAQRVTPTMITMLREHRERNGGNNPRPTMNSILTSSGVQGVAFRTQLGIAEGALTNDEYVDLVQHAAQFI
jgi:hypothetical protein